MNSCLYECHVFHRRLFPKPNEFHNRIFLFALDLDELPALTRQIPFLHHNTPGVYEFRDRDHFSLVPGTARQNAEAFLARHGVAEKPARILLVTNARFFGYIFNPISLWFCLRADGTPIGAIAEVGNTFSELKPYFVPWRDGTFHIRTPKLFYVSPFSDLDWEFDFRFQPPGPHLNVRIDDYMGTEKMLISTLTGKRAALTPANLLALTLRYPFITLRVILLIHWHAFLLWLKRLPFHLKEAGLHLQQGIFRPHQPDNCPEDKNSPNPPA